MLRARGSPLFLFSSVPSRRGGRRATRRMTQVALDRSGSASFPDEPGSPGSGRETSRPAPCGAPTRHLGLYAFDRGRTGPGHSARRGCPSTARGRGCVLHRSQVPLPLPAVKTPPEGSEGASHSVRGRLQKITETLAAQALPPYTFPWTVTDGCGRLPRKAGT